MYIAMHMYYFAKNELNCKQRNNVPGSVSRWGLGAACGIQGSLMALRKCVQSADNRSWAAGGRAGAAWPCSEGTDLSLDTGLLNLTSNVSGALLDFLHFPFLYSIFQDPLLKWLLNEKPPSYSWEGRTLTPLKPDEDTRTEGSRPNTSARALLTMPDSPAESSVLWLDLLCSFLCCDIVCVFARIHSWTRTYVLFPLMSPAALQQLQEPQSGDN